MSYYLLPDWSVLCCGRGFCASVFYCISRSRIKQISVVNCHNMLAVWLINALLLFRADLSRLQVKNGLILACFLHCKLNVS